MQWTKTLVAHVAVAGAAVTAFSYQNAPDAAPPKAPEATSLRHSIATQIVTLKFENQRGEPRPTVGTAKFDRDIESYWISVVGQDVKFTHSTEKQINRELFSVDPFGKVINGKEIEISGQIGLKDGSGNWDDNYEGTLTVAVTAILTDR